MPGMVTQTRGPSTFLNTARNKASRTAAAAETRSSPGNACKVMPQGCARRQLTTLFRPFCATAGVSGSRPRAEQAGGLSGSSLDGCGHPLCHGPHHSFGPWSAHRLSTATPLTPDTRKRAGQRGTR